jgi:hypothetical protein
MTIERLRALSRSVRASALETLVLNELRTALVMNENESLPLDATYLDLGLAGSGAVQVKQRLESLLGCDIDVGTIVDRSTVGDLLTHLKCDVLVDLFDEPVPASDPAIRHTALWDAMLTRDDHGEPADVPEGN